MSTTETQFRLGATVYPGNGVHFSLWAPDAQKVELFIENVIHEAEELAQGVWEVTVPSAKAGAAYQWKINGDIFVPDPVSKWNPDGPHGASVLQAPDDFEWNDKWSGRPWSEAVIYELHIGTFTPEGTYRAAEEKLAGLKELGITAVEILPISTFSGQFGWGYDGVLPFAPFPAYGTPLDLKHFIQAAHGLGLMVLLDVVYNHFGPDGNFLPSYAKSFTSPKHKNPWGDGFNFDDNNNEFVRSFFISNALYWLAEFRFDGLRFDAVHQIKDDSETHFLVELSQTIRETFPERHIHLVVENENNDRSLLPDEGQFTAQWNDDFHHALHVALTGEKNGYFGDYSKQPAALVARALANGFVWEGRERDKEGRRSELVDSKPVTLRATVNYLSNHDQTGNRAFGERLRELVPVTARPLAAALTLLSPATPMIFAGEEFAAETPFQYFADYCGELEESITKGRLEEFGHFVDGDIDKLPRPCTPETFAQCKLDWGQAERPAGRVIRSLVTRLLAIRAAHFTPLLDKLQDQHSFHAPGLNTFVVRWRFEGQVIELRCNLSERSSPSISPQGWPTLKNALPIYTVGTVGPEWWSPWAGQWTMGQEA